MELCWWMLAVLDFQSSPTSCSAEEREVVLVRYHVEIWVWLDDLESYYLWRNSSLTNLALSSEAEGGWLREGNCYLSRLEVGQALWLREAAKMAEKSKIRKNTTNFQKFQLGGCNFIVLLQDTKPQDYLRWPWSLIFGIACWSFDSNTDFHPGPWRMFSCFTHNAHNIFVSRLEKSKNETNLWTGLSIL